MLPFISISLVFIFYTNCSGSNNNQSEPLPVDENTNQGDPAKVVLKVDATESSTTISPLLFGVNVGWPDQGSRIVEYGDLLRDRSFRQQNDVKNRQWVFSPSLATGGSISVGSGVGDPSPPGGHAYNGFVSMAQTSNGYTCVDQILFEGVMSGNQFSLNFSSLGVTGTTALVAFFADTKVMPISSASDYIATVNGTWTRHSLTLTATNSSRPAYFRLCLATAGAVQIDEVRLSQSGLEPQVKQLVKNRLQELKVTSLRFGGSSVDSYFWKSAIGTRISRGELINDLGIYETPSFGLHEFLNLCEELNVEPLLEINVLDSPANASDLIEYILGGEATAMGTLRKNNGRSAPWNVRYFEIGNEPALSYLSGSNYVNLTKSIASAVRSKASLIGKTVLLSGVVEAGFNLANWIAAVPFLQNWNSEVFADSTGIKGIVDFTHGHFYSYNGYDPDEATRFRNVLSGGEVLRKNILEVFSKTGGLPLWLTEFHVNIEKSEPKEILTEYLKDFQSGLVIGQIYFQLINQKIAGAHIFNFSEEVGYGITRASNQFSLRPAGLAFSLMSGIAGDTLINSNLTGAASTVITSGVGIIPSNTSYSNLSSFVSKDSAGSYHVFILNSDYTSAAAVRIQFDGFTPSVGQLFSYSSGLLSDNNESNPDNITIKSKSIPVGSKFEIVIEPHSMMRIDLH